MAGENPMGPGQGGSLTDLVTVQQNAVKYLGLILQAIQTKFPDWVAVPTTATSPGTPGQVAYDSGFIYVCVAPSTWKRVAISTF